METSLALVEEKESSLEDSIPEHILEKYRKALGNTLPARSVKKYATTYHKFCEWQKKNATDSFDQKVLMAYFQELSENYAPSTLWSVYSMLKRMLINDRNLNISSYSQLVDFLKNNSDGYVSKKANVFTPEEIESFMNNAPDEKYLAMKTVMVFALSGASRGDELVNLKFENVSENNGDFIVRIPTCKTKEPKMHVICGPRMTDIVRKYIKLRPKAITSDRFFINYRNGKCNNQVIGKNSIASMPKEIAKFLNLPNAETYTGHSYRRTVTTCAAEAGASSETLQEIGDWKSIKVAQIYVQKSVRNKRKIGNIIANATNMAGKKIQKREPLSTVTSSNIMVSSQHVQVMSQLIQEDNEKEMVEQKQNEKEMVEQKQNDCEHSCIAEQQSVDGPVETGLEHGGNEIYVQPQVANQQLGGCDKSARPIFHFTNCNDIKFSFGK